VLATLGLVLLAWYERSVPVLVVTAVFVLVAVVLLTDPSGILISAGALLGGAFVALLRRRPQAPATAADTP
jgi:hypothetical protein